MLFVEGPSEANRVVSFHILSDVEMRLSPGPLSPFQPKELEFDSTEAFLGVGRVMEICGWASTSSQKVFLEYFKFPQRSSVVSPRNCSLESVV